jgi:hypothetical protein
MIVNASVPIHTVRTGSDQSYFVFKEKISKLGEKNENSVQCISSTSHDRWMEVADVIIG